MERATKIPEDIENEIMAYNTKMNDHLLKIERIEKIKRKLDVRIFNENAEIQICGIKMSKLIYNKLPENVNKNFQIDPKNKEIIILNDTNFRTF